MELDWQSPPLAISGIYKAREWQASQEAVGTSIPPTSSSFVTRRRSSMAHAPPPGPPPSQPIPSVPALPSQYEMYEGMYDGMPDTSEPQRGTMSQMHPYTRPAASANLAAVAAFSQARLAAASTSASISPSPLRSSSSLENLLDSPPLPARRSTFSRRFTAAQETNSDRSLLGPTDVRPEPRPSPRRALTKALELAREAVRLDSTNDDPYGAVVAYGQSVALLSEVMERVMRGEDSTESHRKQNGRRRSVVAQEEEVKRLKSIHDTYADRMNILSLIYSIPLPSTSPPSAYASSLSQSTDSTRPSSPSSISPSAESSDSRQHLQPSLRPRSRDGLRFPSETIRFYDSSGDDELDAAEAIGTALSTSTVLHSVGRTASLGVGAGSSSHPYAASSATPSVSTSLPNRAHTVRSSLRPRASSNLPPPAPPPTKSPPPAPVPAPAAVELTAEPTSASHLKASESGRRRGDSVSSASHSRANSASRLSSLQEERMEDLSSPPSETTPLPTLSDGSVLPRSRMSLHSAPSSVVSHESHPLPPLPSSAGSPITARVAAPVTGSASEPPSPHVATQFTTPRPRGCSGFSVRSEAAAPVNRPSLINTSPHLGTISQRRHKTSIVPSNPSSSPTESTASAASMLNTGRLTASALSASTVSSLGIGSRNRASSQPSRRPSTASGSYFPSGATAMPNGAPAPRKPSIPSRLNPNVPPQISINTALMSPPLGPTTIMPLVPPPPIPYGNIPTAPLSPMPALAPPDPMRKPYHMMSLLRQTMTSKTGGYITRRLHVPQEVWSQGGAKLTNIPEKIRVVEVLCSALDELQRWSVEYFGAGNVSSGMALGIGSIGRKEGEQWSMKLEEFASACDGVVGNFGKKLGVGEGFVTKKSSGVTSWGGKLTRQFDKLTNGKNLDSPAVYVQGLSKLFQQAQLLDEHTKAALSVPPAPLYMGFPIEVRTALEFKLRHASEFFAKVVLTFVIRDMALLLDKYVKKCEKWLAE
ncbi:uncharacterized protein LAESUDRAFT_812489 [Laetiporus sulphureus 93-53]|uniref:MIT domain-containing protein n=1 Tax=Laetiporus sulphureus 93-53 TaxID=1314785 RepID=A0A165EDH9_9APHY|nr:uncharacterized protein LAESUDRAFT_812489 [Laetiporus sulphureus 93-53]KZT06803.1 hypothetical protein LAESUDRAFT_812489 [Laetiporus sulphureus 93-53]